MSRHRRIAAGIWGDERFAALSDDAQRMWFYLLTGFEVTNLPGVLLLGRAALAEALRWDLDRTTAAFSELENAIDPEDGLPLAKADWTVRVVYLPNGITQNPPANPSVVTGWRDPWKAVPECALKAEAFQRYRDHLVSLAKATLLEEFDRVVEIPKHLRGIQLQRTPSSIPSPAPSSTPCQTPSGSQSLAHARATPTPIPTPTLSKGVQGEPPSERLLAPNPPASAGADRLPASEAKLWRDLWIAAYTEGIERIAPGFTFKPQTYDTLARVVGKRIPRDRWADVSGWISEQAQRFARAVQPKAAVYSGFSADGFERWWNAGCPIEATPTPAPTPGRSPPRHREVPELKPLPNPPRYERAPWQPPGGLSTAAPTAGAPPSAKTRPDANAADRPVTEDPRPGGPS